MTARSRKRSTKKSKAPVLTKIRLDIDSWENYRGLMRDTVLGWFVEIAREVLGIKTRSDIQARKAVIKQIISSLTRTSQDRVLKSVHLPIRTLMFEKEAQSSEKENKASLEVSLERALSALLNIENVTIRCGFSGGIPPNLTAELAEHVRGYGGPLRLKREVFELCEDLVYLAEIGAFISKIGVERREQEFIHHYLYTSTLVVLEQTDIDRFNNCIRFKRLGRRLLDGHYYTLVMGTSAFISHYLWSRKKRGLSDYVKFLLERGIVVDYLRLSPGNVLEIRGFEKLVVTEATKFLLNTGLAVPFRKLVSLYPTRSEIEKIKNKDEAKALRELREVIDSTCKNIAKHMNTYTEIRPSPAGYLVVRRDLRPVYEVIRRLGLFVELLEREGEVRRALNKTLETRFKRRTQQELDIAEIAKTIIRRLGIYVQKGSRI